MSQQSFSQIGARMRSKVARSLFGGVQPSRSSNSLALLQRTVAGGNVHSVSMSTGGTDARCGFSRCEQDAIFCGA